MALNNKYRVDIISGASTITMTPANDRLILSYQKDGGRRFYRKVLKTALRFIGTDFEFFRDEVILGTCFSLPVEIYRNADGAGFDLWYTGTITMASAKFDYDRGYCDMTVEPDDLYSCLSLNLKKKINLLEYGTPVAAFNVLGTFETVTCYDQVPFTGTELATFSPVDCVPGGAAASQYIMLGHRQMGLGSISGASVLKTTEWTREVIFSAPPAGSGFVSVGGGKYARPAIVVQGEWKASPDNPTGVWLQSNRLIDFGKNLGLDNGRKVKEILPLIMDDMDCDLGFASDMLDIDPPGDAPANFVYTRAANRLADLTVYERTDVTRWAADSNATILEVVFEDFIKYIEVQFQAAWSIELIGGVPKFRIEHVSYYEASNQNDFTVAPFARHIRGKNSFEFVSQDEIPRYEQFSFGDTKTGYFNPSRILYQGCGASAATKEVSIPFVSNDLAWLAGGSESKDGISFVSIYEWEGKNYIFNDYGVLNGAMCWRELLSYYYTHERPTPDFAIQSGAWSDSYSAISFIRNRKQATFTIPVDADTQNDFNPALLQKSGLGWGEVESAEYDTLTNALTITLLH